MNLPSRFTSSARGACTSSFTAWQLVRARLRIRGQAFFSTEYVSSLRGGLATLLVLLLGLGLCGSARAVPTFSLSPSTLTTSVGSTFTLDLMANDVDQGIGGWSLALLVGDGGVASLTHISFGSALGAVGTQALGFGDSTAVGSSPGVGSQRFEFGVASLMSAADLVAFQGSSFRLATLSFVALAAGTTELMLAAPTVGALLSDAAGNAVSVGWQQGAAASVSVSVAAPVSPVPEPPSGALLLSGLACLAVASRARRRR